MRTLFHTWLDGDSRAVRAALAEKALEAELSFEKTWEARPAFLALSPDGRVPVLTDDVVTATGLWPILEHLEAAYPEAPLLPTGLAARAEARRVLGWMSIKFQAEVGGPIVGERVDKRFLGLGAPDTEILRAGRQNLASHLDYLEFLLDKRGLIVGDRVGLADLSVAAHLSCVDYLDEIAWDGRPALKTWYARLKSQPAIRGLLADTIPGLTPPAHYADPDF